MEEIPEIWDFRMDRLQEFFRDRKDPWGAGFREVFVKKARLVPESFSAYVETEGAQKISEGFAAICGRTPAWSGRKHAGRVRFLMGRPDLLSDPIVIDCVCAGGRVYPIPILIDGWHRYFAHKLLGSPTIRASFGGVVDLAEYLSGRSDVLER